jgi:hypothetical protein
LFTQRTTTAPLSRPDVRSRRGLIALGTGLLASLLTMAGLASSASADDRVYWTNSFDAGANAISYANLNEGGGGNLNTTGATVNAPRGLAMDVAAGKVYWTNRLGNSISFANLDESAGASDLNTAGIGATVNLPNGAAVDPAARKIYWANEDGQISFAELDNTGIGTGVGGNLNITNPAVDLPLNPMVDGSGRIYWGNSASNVISWANLNGPGGGNLATGPANPVANAHGVALDPVENKIYWANVGNPLDPVNPYAGNGISYVDLDTGVGGVLTPTNTTVNVPIGVAIDATARRIYWANWRGNTISWANLDTGVGGNVPTPNALDGPRSPVLLKAPSGEGAPVITGGSSAGSVLTCSRGEWAPDQLASWLYRAPHDFTYSWSRNGTAIPEANGATYTASEGGNYSCTVTASNPAGSSQPQTSAARTVSASSGNNPPPPAAKPSPPTGNPSKPSTGPAAKPLAFGSKTLTTMSVSGRRISGNGPIKVVISNKNGFQVSGTLSARAKRVKVSRGFAVGANAKKTVRVKLSKALKRMLKRQGKLSLRLTVKVNDPAGNTRTVRKNVSLRLKTG